MKTLLTELLGIEHPIMLAGMNGVAWSDVVAAVSEAGGCGVLGRRVGLWSNSAMNARKSDR